MNRGGETPSSGGPRPAVIVTRPEADAGRLLDALRQRGRTAIALPVLGIEAVADRSPLVRAMATVDGYRLVVFVSPNAIRRALAERQRPWPAGVAVGVMGPGSVAALREAGIVAPSVHVISPATGEAPERPAIAPRRSGPRFDSEGLFDVLDEALALRAGFDGRVLIVRGNGGRAWLAERLRSLGIAVDEIEAYRRVRPVADPAAADALADLVRANADATIVLTSSEGVDHLVAIVESALAARDGIDRDAVRAWLFGAGIVAPHPRIAERARAAGFGRVTLCTPGDDGILAAIE